jgi:prepilin-type N-terminal cleavage/methylation domain-containing protein
MHMPRHSERGFTLIESMISVAIFAVGVVGLVPLFYRSTEGITTSSRMVQATVLAESKLDELMRLPYASPLLDISGSPFSDGTQNIGPAGTPYTPTGAATAAYGEADGWFARSWTIEEKDYNLVAAGNDYKIIRVTVTWTDSGSKRQRTVTLAGGKAALE